MAQPLFWASYGLWIRIMRCPPSFFSITKSNSTLELLPTKLVKLLFIGLFDSFREIL